MTRLLPCSTLHPAANRMMQVSCWRDLAAILSECAAKTAIISAITSTTPPLARFRQQFRQGSGNNSGKDALVRKYGNGNPTPPKPARQAHSAHLHRAHHWSRGNLRQDSGNNSGNTFAVRPLASKGRGLGVRSATFRQHSGNIPATFRQYLRQTTPRMPHFQGRRIIEGLPPSRRAHTSGTSHTAQRVIPGHAIGTCISLHAYSTSGGRKRWHR